MSKVLEDRRWQMGDKKSVVLKGREEGKGAGWEIQARQQPELAPSFVASLRRVKCFSQRQSHVIASSIIIVNFLLTIYCEICRPSDGVLAIHCSTSAYRLVSAFRMPVRQMSHLCQSV